MAADFSSTHSHGPESTTEDYSPGPEPEPPPDNPQIHVCDVPPWEYVHDTFQPTGVSFTSNESSPPPSSIQDQSHLLWDTFMFPSEEVEDRTISPATILKILAMHDETTFTSPFTRSFLRNQHF